MTAKKDYTGKKCGHLHFLERVRYQPTGAGSIWLLECDCGNRVEKSSSAVLAGRVKTCGNCKYSRRLKSSSSRAVWEKFRTRRAAYRDLQDKADKYGVRQEIEPAEFIELTDKSCHYCNRPSTEKERSRLDRLDISGNYIVSNVVPACVRCRRLRGSFNYPEFLEQVEKIHINMNKLTSEKSSVIIAK